MGLRSSYIAMRRRYLYSRCIAAPARLIVLRYHSVGAPEQVQSYLDPGLSLSPQRFREQLRWITEHCEVITADEIPARIAARKARRLAIAITFDDGFRDNYTTAFPILCEFGLRASFFITTGPLISGLGLWISELWRIMPQLSEGQMLPPKLLPGEEQVPPPGAEREQLRRRITRRFAGLTAPCREAFLDDLARLAGIPRGEGLSESFVTPEQIRQMRAAGMLIGAHSRSHPHLDHLAVEHHAEEVDASRDDLAKILGEPIRHFAYPNPSGGGRFAELAVASIRRADFVTALTSSPGPINEKTTLLRLPRLGVYAGAQEKLLFALLDERAGTGARW